MKIRLAALHDVSKLCKLYEQFFAYNARQQPEYFRNAEERGRYPTNIIGSPTEDLFVAVDGDAVVGMILVKEAETLPFPCFVPHRYAEVTDVFLEPPYRGMGLGKQLMEACERWARARGLDYLELNVLDTNEVGKKFYDKMGFQTVSRNIRLKL